MADGTMFPQQGMISMASEVGIIQNGELLDVKLHGESWSLTLQFDDNFCQ